MITGKKIKLKCEIEKNLPNIESDFTKINQIIKNLVSNAIKFTENGYVTIEVKALEDSIQVQIKDTGCGIPKENMQSIFESFKQIDNSIQKRFGGTGLGLAITKRLCDMLAIKISLDSEENKGTIFTLHIPIQKNKTSETKNFIAKEEHKINNIASIVCMGERAFFLFKDAVIDMPIEAVYIENVEQCVLKAKEKMIWAIVLEPGTHDKTLKDIKSNKMLCHVPIVMCGTSSQQIDHLPDLKYLTIPTTKKELLNVLLKVDKEPIKDILVVDDNEINLDLIGSVLKKEAYTIYKANSGQSAIAIALEKRPQVIIMDLAMPGMDGFEATKMLLENDKNSEFVIIACSAFVSEEFKQRAKEVGCEGYITKPLDPQICMEQIKQSVLISKIKRKQNSLFYS